jgi:hypothetical protein
LFVLPQGVDFKSNLGGMVDNPERGDSYVPTAASAVYMPRLGHHVWNGTAWVNEGLLHESEARTNLIVQSEVVDGTGWTDIASISTNLTDNALGVFNGVSIASNGATFQRLVTATDPTVVSGTTYVFSCLLKQGTSGRLRITFRNNTASTETNLNGLFGNLIPISSTTGSAEVISQYEFGPDVTAVSIRYTPNFSGAVSVGIGPDSAVVGETVIAYAAQLEAAPTPSSYIPTSGSTVTRAADVLTIPAANLPWPSPVVIGPELGNPDNLDKRAGTDGTVTRSGGVINFVNAVSGLSLAISEQITGLTVGNVYRFTAQIRLVSGADLALQVRSGSGGGGDTLATGNFLSSSSFTNSEVIWVATATSAHFSIKAASGSEFEVQEASYSVREINPLAVSIQMDGRVTYADLDQNTAARFVQWAADSNTRFSHILTSAFGTGGIAIQQVSGGVFDQSADGGSTYLPNILVPYNIAARHGSTFLQGAVDGTALTANTTPVALPDLSATNLLLADTYNGTIRTFRIWAQDIGDAGLVEATEPSLVPSLSLTFDGTENSFIVEDWS